MRSWSRLASVGWCRHYHASENWRARRRHAARVGYDDDEIADGVTSAGHASLGGTVTVGECAYFEQGLREGLSIGARAVVGMGAVVLRSVPAGEIWAGVPARKIGEVAA